MSGDREPRDYVAGLVRALDEDRELRALVVGDTAVMNPLLAAMLPAPLRERIEGVHAAEVVTMDESPREAIRRKKQSSMRVAIDLVKDGRAMACVSAGNTGALTAMAHFVLKT